MEENQKTEVIVGRAIEVHRALGRWLPESAYKECLCYESKQAGLNFLRQVALPAPYKNVKLDCGYRMNLVVEGLIAVEIKAVEQILKIHEVQLLSYLRLDKKSLGLLINFLVPILKNGIRRVVNNFRENSASPRLCVETLVKNGEKQ